MPNATEELVRKLYEALSHLSLTIDEARVASSSTTDYDIDVIGLTAKTVRPIMADACCYLLDSGYSWDGSRFVRKHAQTADALCL